MSQRTTDKFNHVRNVGSLLSPKSGKY